jgi:hypothetical protein
MNILLCYGYIPYTTAVYFERALSRQHNVSAVCTAWGDRLGRSRNEDVHALVEAGALPRPDLVVFMESGIKFFPRGLEKFDCPTVGYLIDVHSGLPVREKLALFFDHLFICHKDYVPHFQRLGYPSVHWMPVGCDPEIHGEVPAERVYEVGFVGRAAARASRQQRLTDVERRYKMNDLRRAYPKEELTQIYSRSKIAFNYAANKDVNMRVFEALAAGALLVTNPMENGIDELLTAGEQYVQYTDEASMFEAIDYYLAHDTERERIARAGQAAVLSRHTYEHRTRDMLAVVAASAVHARSAKVRSMSAGQLRRAYADVYSSSRMVDAAFDEFDTAWASKQGRLVASALLAKTFLRRLNVTVQWTHLFKPSPRSD